MSDEVASHQRRMVGFFEEDHESRSLMRLMCYMSLIASFFAAAVTLGIAQWGKDSVAQYGLTIFFALLGAAFGGKIIQKFAENKS
jgi:hypothetical protein